MVVYRNAQGRFVRPEAAFEEGASVRVEVILSAAEKRAAAEESSKDYDEDDEDEDDYYTDDDYPLDEGDSFGELETESP